MVFSTKFEMCDIVKEIATGVSGTVMGISIYATGCIHYGIAPPMSKDGTVKDWLWFDESRLKFVKKGENFSVFSGNKKTKSTSGPDMNQKCY